MGNSAYFSIQKRTTKVEVQGQLKWAKKKTYPYCDITYKKTQSKLEDFPHFWSVWTPL